VTDDLVIYLIYDCHYYLKDWTPTNVKPFDRYECVGANFFHGPGRYALPFREGLFTVTNDAKIHMTPSGGGVEYTHDLVELMCVEKSVDFGWYKLCHARGSTQDFSILPIKPTGFNGGRKSV
jgi:hypothetical protein